MAFSVTCPQCRATLKSANPIAAGKKVKCPKCARTFEAPALEDAAAVSTAPMPVGAVAKVSDADVPEVEVSAEDEEAPRRPPQEDDDEPRPSKKRRRDDDEDDERGPSRKAKRKKGGMGWVMLGGGVVGGGLLLLLGCGACGGLGYLIYSLVTASPIVGSWEPTNNVIGARTTVIFRADGTGQVNVPPVQINFKYRLKNTLLEIDTEQALFGKGFNRTERYTCNIQGNNMTWINIENQPFVPRELHFRKIK
jgi:hypothetical protein